MSSDRKCKILLTGAAGALGSAVRALAGDLHELVGLDIATGGDPAIHPGSFADAACVAPLIAGCDAVIHTAALHGGHKQTHTPTQYTEVNVGGLVTLLELCLQHSVRRFVFSSTMEVLIGVDWTASGMAVVDELTTPNPDWIYPVNKLACEQIGSYYHRKHGIEFIALRYMAFVQDTQPSPAFLSRYLMPRDVAAANLLAATLPGLACETLNIGPETPLTQHDIVQAMTDPYAVVDRYWPGASSVLRSHAVALHPAHFWPVTRIERAKRVLGWQPETTFETYLRSLGWQNP